MKPAFSWFHEINPRKIWKYAVPQAAVLATCRRSLVFQFTSPYPSTDHMAMSQAWPGRQIQRRHVAGSEHIISLYTMCMWSCSSLHLSVCMCGRLGRRVASCLVSTCTSHGSWHQDMLCTWPYTSDHMTHTQAVRHTTWLIPRLSNTSHDSYPGCPTQLMTHTQAVRHLTYPGCPQTSVEYDHKCTTNHITATVLIDVRAREIPPADFRPVRTISSSSPNWPLPLLPLPLRGHHEPVESPAHFICRQELKEQLDHIIWKDCTWHIQHN